MAALACGDCGPTMIGRQTRSPPDNQCPPAGTLTYRKLEHLTCGNPNCTQQQLFLSTRWSPSYLICRRTRYLRLRSYYNSLTLCCVHVLHDKEVAPHSCSLLDCCTSKIVWCTSGYIGQEYRLLWTRCASDTLSFTLNLLTPSVSTTGPLARWTGQSCLEMPEYVTR